MLNIYLFIIVIVATLAIEIILSLSWSPFYYRHGILLFKKKYLVKQINIYFYDIGKLNAEFDESSSNIGHIFGQIGTNDIGIRVKVNEVFRFPLRGFIPVLHGNIQYDPNKKELTLKCFSDWTVTILLILIFVINLPLIIQELSIISAYGSLYINLLFFIFIAFCIMIIPVVIATYQVAQLKKVADYLSEGIS